MENICLEIKEKLDRIPVCHLPLKEHAHKYMKYASTIDEDKTLHIGHRPWVAPSNYVITLFSSVNKDWFQLLNQRQGIIIPSIYQELLLTTNGCFYYELSLFGLPPSMQNDSPILNRRKLQCHDLGTANRNWIRGYNLDRKMFHFGSREYSYSENIGYFIDGENIIKSIRKNGEIINEWSSITEFLRHELDIAESMMRQEDTPEKW